jgi:hypothetical protein
MTVVERRHFFMASGSSTVSTILTGPPAGRLRAEMGVLRRLVSVPEFGSVHRQTSDDRAVVVFPANNSSAPNVLL